MTENHTGMQTAHRPSKRPNDPRFSPGPTRKNPNWTWATLEQAALGRSHRSTAGKAKLQEVIDRSKAILKIPKDWKVAILPGSDTGAVEAALWSLFGQRPVDVLAWENFGNDWAIDLTQELPINDVRFLEADYGQMPDLNSVNFSHDVCFTYNGTTSGVCVNGGEWIPSNREGLVLCDATSAAFAMPLPWDKLDIVTWSWQKVLGGEAGHGMLALGPRAQERALTYKPSWPVPKVLRLHNGDKLDEGLFNAVTINTPSLLATEDCLAALDWAETIGGLEALITRSKANAAAFDTWITAAPWADYLCEEPRYRSTTSLCFKIIDPAFTALSREEQNAFCKRLSQRLADEGAAYDLDAYRTAPPGFRVWGGGTVEAEDITLLGPWLDWAFAQEKTSLLGKN